MKKNTKDHYESVAEELKMNGFKVSIVNGKSLEIHYDTIAGLMKYSCSEKTIMGDYYRFVSHFGGKLHKWGLYNKIKTKHKLIT